MRHSTGLISIFTMKSIKLSCNNIIIIVALIATHWQVVSSVNTLESTPPAVNGVLSVCAGEHISLTCSHDNVDTGGTRWIASPPVNCLTTVSHIGTKPLPPPPCGPFMFQGITPLEPVIPVLLNSTTMAVATLSMTGTNVECRGGNSLSFSFSVGNITLSVGSVLDPVFDSINTICSAFLPNDLTRIILEWDTSSQVTTDNVYYTIIIDGAAVPPDRISVINSTHFIVSSLEANRVYTASVNRIVHSEPNCTSYQSNVTFEIRAETPTPTIEAQFYCANSSDLTTVALSWMFPSSAPPGIVYPPEDELSATVLVSNASGLVSDTTFPASQSYAFFHLRNDANYTVSVKADHNTIGFSTPKTIQLTTSIYAVDPSTTLQHDQVIVTLNSRCREGATSFMTSLSQGSCPNSLQYMTSKVFNNSGVASFKLNIENVIGNVCIQVETSHQSQPSIPLRTFEQELTLNRCSVASINSVASSSVIVEFSLAENSGVVPHGTIATFKPRSCADQLVGADRATCLNGLWSDLSHHTSSASSLSVSEAVVITFVLSTISALIVGAMTSSLIAYFIMKRWASKLKHPAIDQSKGALYEEVSQPEISGQVFEMGENIAYGPVTR